MIILAAGLLAGSLTLPAPHRDPAATSSASRAGRLRANGRWRVGQWLLSVQRDGFTGTATCRLERGRVHLERQALVVQLPGYVDTANANYRIDSGGIVSVAEERPALAIQGFQVWKDDSSNPSAAVVRVPLTRLAGAHAISIEPHRNSRIWTVAIDGLAQAMTAARREGCPGV